MDIIEAEQTLNLITERCNSDEEIADEIDKLDSKEKNRILGAITRARFLEDCSKGSDLLLKHLQDHEEFQTNDGRLSVDVILGMMKLLSNIYKDINAKQAREELQKMTAGSQFVCNEINTLSDIAAEIEGLVDTAIINESYVSAYMFSRSLGIELTDDIGNSVEIEK